MSIKIDQKIVNSSVVTNAQKAAQSVAQTDTAQSDLSNVVRMHEAIERPESLEGSTYKISNSLLDHSLFLTINHIVLNAGTKHETVRPFEIFLATKDATSQSWITSITLLMSAVFRKGGDFSFLISELKSVHDVRGGVFLPGGIFVPSVMAHIGMVLEEHFYKIGALKKAQLSAEVKLVVEAKREEATKAGALAQAAICPKCNDKALVILDGCNTCLSCGFSKCG